MNRRVFLLATLLAPFAKWLPKPEIGWIPDYGMLRNLPWVYYQPHSDLDWPTPREFTQPIFNDDEYREEFYEALFAKGPIVLDK